MLRSSTRVRLPVTRISGGVWRSLTRSARSILACSWVAAAGSQDTRKGVERIPRIAVGDFRMFRADEEGAVAVADSHMETAWFDGQEALIVELVQDFDLGRSPPRGCSVRCPTCSPELARPARHWFHAGPRVVWMNAAGARTCTFVDLCRPWALTSMSEAMLGGRGWAREVGTA